MKKFLSYYAKSNDFDVVILVTSINNSQVITDDVAFFLADDVGEEIKFQPVIDGIAQIHLTSSKTFTVGAYTQDGQCLKWTCSNKVPTQLTFTKRTENRSRSLFFCRSNHKNS